MVGINCMLNLISFTIAFYDIFDPEVFSCVCVLHGSSPLLGRSCPGILYRRGLVSEGEAGSGGA